MPWQEVVTVELRQQFVHDALRRVVPVTELCAAYGISRKTGYKFLARYDALGAAGLADQSRRPHRSPAALHPVLLQRLLEAHQRHPYWGPRKLLRLVGQRWPDAPWPVRSTVARCFQHLGLVTARRRVRRPGSAGPPSVSMDAPNAVWTTDYKGQFKLGRRPVLLPPHRGRRLQSDAAGLSGPHQHPAGRGPARLRAALPRVRAPPADSLR